MNPLLIIQILQLLPTLARTVKELVDVFERSGQGKLKKHAVMHVTGSIIDGCELPMEGKDRLHAAVYRIIDEEVKLRNAVQQSDGVIVKNKSLGDYNTYILKSGEMFAPRDTLPEGYEWVEPIIVTPSGFRVARKVQADTRIRGTETEYHASYTWPKETNEI